MKNKKMLTIIVICLTLVELTTIFLMTQSLQNKPIDLDKVSLKQVKEDNLFAIYIEQEDGTYVESEENSLLYSQDGYEYNADMSGCIDSSGNKIENSLIYDSSSQNITIKTKGQAYCYVYYKKVDTLCRLASDSTVAAGEYGAKYNCKVDPNKDEYTFYLIKNNTDGTSDLIMNANINALGEAVIPGVTADQGIVAWDSNGVINYGPRTALDYLYNATKNWTNINPLNYKYNTNNSIESSYKSLVVSNGVGVLVPSDNTTPTIIGTSTEPLRARMPIYSSDTTLTDIVQQNETNGFLYENLLESYGYWTMSPESDDPPLACHTILFDKGYVESGDQNSVADNFFYGVRPIINVEL